MANANDTLLQLQAQSASARNQMAFQERMSNTAHQREVADLRAAGLNPVLSAGGNGASTPNGASGDISGAEIVKLIQSTVDTTAKAVTRVLDSDALSGSPEHKGIQVPLSEPDHYSSIPTVYKDDGSVDWIASEPTLQHMKDVVMSFAPAILHSIGARNSNDNRGYLEQGLDWYLNWIAERGNKKWTERNAKTKALYKQAYNKAYNQAILSRGIGERRTNYLANTGKGFYINTMANRPTYRG